jgi:hypothetical protein
MLTVLGKNPEKLLAQNREGEKNLEKALAQRREEERRIEKRIYIVR